MKIKYIYFLLKKNKFYWTKVFADQKVKIKNYWSIFVIFSENFDI